MRTSRISQETSRIISATPFSPPAKRATRASLSRFAHISSPTKTTEDLENEDPAADIEDVVLPHKKRKRESITSTTRITPRKIISVKTETVDFESASFSPSKEKTTRVRKPARQIKNEDGEVEIHPPNDWEEVYKVVMDMRKNGPAKGAAVDTMGCERLAAEEVSPRDKRFQTLTALMLSSQTKDTTNAIAMKRLQTELPAHTPGAPPGLNLENILAVDPRLLNELIWVVGFHNNKTKYIKAAAEILRDSWGGDIPDTIEGLMSLPGVGPKMGYLCLSVAWGKTEGIGVDVHVHRITNLWGWHKTKTPEETRVALQAWLPRELWHEINWLLVGFGQTVCLPVGRKCGECELGLNGLCKAADRSKVTIGRKARAQNISIDEGGVVVDKGETVDIEQTVNGVLAQSALDTEVKVESHDGISPSGEVAVKDQRAPAKRRRRQ